MPALTIRNLPDELYARLQKRAARAGRSVEEEARSILTEACAPQEKDDGPALQAWVDQLYHGHPPSGVVESLMQERRQEAANE